MGQNCRGREAWWAHQHSNLFYKSMTCNDFLGLSFCRDTPGDTRCALLACFWLLSAHASHAEKGVSIVLTLGGDEIQTRQIVGFGNHRAYTL